MSNKFRITLLLYCCVAVNNNVHGSKTEIRQHQCDCGRANERASKIVGGAEVTPYKYPWMVTVLTADNLCGGALITRQYVLTAAHCVKNMENKRVGIMENIRVGIAVHDKNRPGQVIAASDVKIHPYFSRTKKTELYDIALIKLQRAIIISEKVRTLCLPHNLIFEQRGKQAINAGWGMTQPKNIASESRFLKEINLRIVKTNMAITAEGVNRTAACMGDSGSPLFTKYADGRYHVIGVTSTSVGGPLPCMGVSNYARVFIHNRWIKENTRDSPPCEKPNDQMARVATNYL